MIAATAVICAINAVICSPSPLPASCPEAPKVVTVAYAGDSTTARAEQWLHFIAADKTVKVVGGYAHSGYTTAQVAPHIKATGANVGIVMLGINDIHYPATNSIPAIVERINSIAVKLGTKETIIGAVAPSNVTLYTANGSKNLNPRAVQAKLDDALKADALIHGWTYVDAYATIRNFKTNGFTSTKYVLADRTHPSAAGGKIAAAQFSKAAHAVIAKDIRCTG